MLFLFNETAVDSFILYPVLPECTPGMGMGFLVGSILLTKGTINCEKDFVFKKIFSSLFRGSLC